MSGLHGKKFRLMMKFSHVGWETMDSEHRSSCIMYKFVSNKATLRRSNNGGAASCPGSSYRHLTIYDRLVARCCGHTYNSDIAIVILISVRTEVRQIWKVYFFKIRKVEHNIFKVSSSIGGAWLHVTRIFSSFMPESAAESRFLNAKRKSILTEVLSTQAKSGFL